MEQLGRQWRRLGFFDVSEFRRIRLKQHLVADELHDLRVWGHFRINANRYALDVHDVGLFVGAKVRGKCCKVYI